MALAHLGIFKKLLFLLINPKKCFSYICTHEKEETDVTNYLLFWFFFFAASLFIFYVDFTGPLLDQLFWIAFLDLAGILALYVATAIVHTTIVIPLGGEDSFYRTFQTITYALTPVYLFSWLYSIKYIAIGYSVYLAILGFTKLLNVDFRKASIIAAFAFVVVGLGLSGVVHIYPIT